MAGIRADSGRLPERRAELMKKRAKLIENLEQVQRFGSAMPGEQCVAMREDKTLLDARISEIDHALAQQ
ncbi:hypothetical protein [Nocardia yamanashiensis]|uniref:hypothetical protein n=1 Tax=Nocardia yamanashiensis TaxID=209247 RepID=UPI000A721F9A|nr:hypothetical protein [Nocardia yamanashiensis]